jgi:hypothetical protein
MLLVLLFVWLNPDLLLALSLVVGLLVVSAKSV